MVNRISHWIDGAVVPGNSGRSGPVYNPATGEQTGEVDLASTAEVAAAVASAKAAAKEWRSASLSRRSAVLFAAWALDHSPEEAVTEVRVRITLARLEVERMAEHRADDLPLVGRRLAPGGPGELDGAEHRVE